MTPQKENTGIPTATDVVSRYESLRDQGQEVTPEALCQQLGCPHLLDEVQRQIRNLRSLEQFLSRTTVEYQTRARPAEQGASGPETPFQTDQYEILHRLGQGGFGIVWRALDKELGRPVAIKVPRPDRRFSQDEIDLLYKEARKAAALDHPNIVRVYHAGRLGKTFFVVSQFIDGGNLGARMPERPFAAEESARLVAQVAEALHHAHLSGFVHRDVKPGNILLGRDLKPYLTDFGLAVTEEEQLEEPAGVIGTVAYMSPEQAEGGNNRVDARTDIYSLGVVLYELLTRRLPFVAKNSQEYLEQVRHREPRPPRTIDDSLPLELERICLKCLAKEVTGRYTTAADLAADLRRWLERDSAAPPAPVAPGVAEPAAATPRRRRWPLAVAAGVLALVGLGLLLVVKPWDSPPTLRSEGPEGKPQPGGVAATPGVWQNLLEQKPVSLLQATRGSVWSYDAKKKEFWWDAHEDCMFRLGSTRSDDFEFEVLFVQTHLAGHRGLFLGYRPESEEDGPPRSQVLLIVPDALKRGRYLLFQGTVAVDGVTKQVRGMKPRGPHIPLPQLGEKQFTLSVRVKGGKLASVRVDQVPVNGQLLGGAADPPLALHGEFGVFADYHSARVSHARWKTFTKEN